MLLKKVLYCYDYMYGRFTYPESFCRLPYGRLMFNDIACDLHCPLLNILLHKNPCIHSFYNVCRGTKSHAFLSRSVPLQVLSQLSLICLYPVFYPDGVQEIVGGFSQGK